MGNSSTNKSWLTRVFTFLGSVRLTVPLLLVCAAAMAAGTFIESAQGASAARTWVYQTLWFEGLMGLIALNVVLATLTRWPWRRRHLGFWVTHLGIVILLIGAALTRRFGFEGMLELAENQTNSAIHLEQNVLEVQVSGLPQAQTFPVKFTPSWWSHPPYRHQLAGTTTQLVIEECWPHATPRSKITGEGKFVNPAIHYRLSSAMSDPMEHWLVALDREQNQVSLGPLSVAFNICDSSAMLEEHLAAPKPETASAELSTLTIQMPDGPGQTLSFAQDLSSGSAAVGDTSWTVEVLERFLDAVVEPGKGLAERSQTPRNPAVKVRLTSPEGKQEMHTAFANFPDFSSKHGQKGGEGGPQIKYVYKAAATPANSSHLLQVFVMPHDQLVVTLPAPDGGRKALYPKSNEEIETPWMGIKFTLMEYLPKAQEVDVWEPAAADQGQPAVRFSLHQGAQTAEGWAGGLETQPTEVDLNQVKHQVRLKPQTLELGFKLQLLDFKNPKFGGTGMAAKYSSDVRLIDPAVAGGGATHTISMNSPLDYRGYRFFQSSYRETEGQPPVSIFSVQYDPGVWPVYLGCFLIVLGTILIFYLPRGARVS